MRILYTALLFILIAGAAESQGTRYRGSIPEVLLRPARSETLHYPIDTVIGEMGQGAASDAAFSYANWVAAGLLSGRMNHPSLEMINSVVREQYLSALGGIQPRFYRIGGGREEPDGSTSFLLRFVGRDMAITAEMYVRHAVIREASASAEIEIFGEDEDGVEERGEDEDGAGEAVFAASETAAGTLGTATWMLEDLILEEALSREQEERASMYRVDSVMYERFF